MKCSICLIAMTTTLLARSALAGDRLKSLLSPFIITEDPKPCHIKYQQFPGHTMCLPRSPNARSVNITEEFKQKILDNHNMHRAQVDPPATNMMKMRWDDEMEEFAKRWAEACEFRDGLEHDHQRFIPGSMFVGQSMASTTIDFTIAMEHWWFEKNDYSYGVDYKEQLYNAKKCGFMVGHYTQMVWAHSYLVGCAATTCDNKNNVIVCNYGPSGNMLPFGVPYEEGPQCSKCKNCTEEGLCDCGDVNCHGGTLDPSTCTCNCVIEADGIAPDFVNEGDCSLNCSGKDFEYCGYDLFDDCHDSWTAKKCPHMCKVCPYAEAGYVHPNESTSDESSNTHSASNTDGTDVYGGDGTLAVNGTSIINGTSTVNGTFIVNGTSIVNGASIVNGTYIVNGTEYTYTLTTDNSLTTETVPASNEMP